MPAWPPDWDADFRLHAPYQTVVEGRQGEVGTVAVTQRLFD